MRTQNLIVEQRRGGIVEGVHPVDAVLVDPQGRVLEQVGEDLTTTFRSAAKPFQLEVSLACLSDAQRGTLTAEDLAIGAASHHGEPFHIAEVQRLLSKLGRERDHLYCGAHAPTHGPSMQELYARGDVPSALHNNCAGKHTFMAAAAHALGAPVDYRSVDHPLQRMIRAQLDERTSGGIVTSVVDGCGVPCFVLPLRVMAQLWAQLAVEHKSGLHQGLGAVGRAMSSEPLMFSGTTAFDGFLTRSAPVVAKIGAQGLLCVALPERGLGVAVRVRSGADVARPAAALFVLNLWFPGLVPLEAGASFCEVTNVVGAHVGEIAVRFA